MKIKNNLKLLMSFIFIIISIFLIWKSIIDFNRVDINISAENLKYKNQLESIKKTNSKLKEDIESVDKKLNLLSDRRETLQNLVTYYDYESNKYNDYISKPLELDFNYKNILKIEPNYSNGILNSYYFKNIVEDIDVAKINLLISSIGQNDYIISQINYNLLKSNIEAYKYNGILNYYNSTNSYFIKSKLQINSKDSLKTLYNNMLSLKKLGLEMLDHLSFTGISSKKSIELQNLKNEMSKINSSEFNIPEKYTSEYYDKLLFGTEIYNIIAPYTDYIKEVELIHDESTLRGFVDSRNRVYLISEMKNDAVKNYYYDTSGNLYKVIDFSDGIQSIDIMQTKGLSDKSKELYNVFLKNKN